MHETGPPPSAYTEVQAATSVPDETQHIGNTTTIEVEKSSHNEYCHSPINNSGLCDETGHLSDTEFNDKIDAAQGLLLLGTDVSSADDSQDLPEPPEPNLNLTIDSGSATKTPTPKPSPRKGVLNLRQIGIKRHQPVDSSDPSAIGSPSGSPSTELPKQNKPTSRKKKEHNKTKRKNNKQNKPVKLKMRETGRKKDKDNQSTLSTTKASVPKPVSVRAKTSTRQTPISTTTPATVPHDQDESPDGKYSIKRTVVNGTIYYICSLCDRKYDTLHGLNNHHAKTHPPVNCDVCNRQFSTPNSLIHHSYTHLEQSFHCDQCDKSFPFRSQLENHVAAHTQEIKHTCEKCGKHFVRTGEYNIHMRGHSNIRIQCPVDGCDYETVDARNLTSHKKSHTKKISVYCKTCGKGFVYHEQRKRHMYREHP